MDDRQEISATSAPMASESLTIAPSRQISTGSVRRQLVERSTSSSPMGATVTSEYHDRKQDIVGIEVGELRHLRIVRLEEFWQFSIAQFFIAGGLWLGIERAFTEQEFWNDLLFWICIIAAVAGSVIGFFAYRQLARRNSRVDEIIETAERNRESAGA